MANKNLYRGYEKIFTAFKNAKSNNQLQHAYGFVGRHKSGKGALVKIIANELLDSNERMHPDLLEYVSDDENNSVEILRKFLTDFQGTPIIASCRIAILYALDALSSQQQNTLLKTLEEPPKNHIVLCTFSSISKILPTVASRLVQIELPKIPFSEIQTLPESTQNQLLKNAYAGNVESYAHITQEKLSNLQEIYTAIQTLYSSRKWQTVETLFTSTKDLSQLKQILASWLPLLRNELTQNAHTEQRITMIKIISGFSQAYHASNLTTARLSIEKSLI